MVFLALALPLAGIDNLSFSAAANGAATLGQYLFGFAIVNARGDPASRGRLLFRWLVAWPLLFLAVVFGYAGAGGWFLLSILLHSFVPRSGLFAESREMRTVGLGRQRLQAGKHRWDQFRDCWMDMHGPLDHGVRGVGVHHVHNRVNEFVAADAEDVSVSKLSSVSSTRGSL